MTRSGQIRIAFFLQGSQPGGIHPYVSPLTGAIVAFLRERGAHVELIVPESRPLEIAQVRPEYDLYVLKEKTPLTLSLAGVLTAAGAAIVNSFRSCSLARDKITATAVLAAASIPVPQSWTTGRSALLRPLISEGPLWLKPHRGSRGIGVRRVTDLTDLNNGPDAFVDSYGLPLPLFVQQEVPSSGRDVKVYVVGNKIWAISRPFPAPTLQEKIGTPVCLTPEIQTAALSCGQALGLEIYGVDFLVTKEKFFVIDVNAFPGYKGVREAPSCLADYVYERARRAHHNREVTL